MTPFAAFLIGAFASGFVLALVFGSIHLEEEHKAYWRGYCDGIKMVKEVE